MTGSGPDAAGLPAISVLNRLRIPARLLLPLLLLSLPVPNTWSRPGPSNTRGPQPETYITTHFTAEGAAGARVRVALPRAALVFKKDEGRFRTGLRVTVIVKRDGKRLGGGIATAFAEADTYEQTRTNSRLEAQQLVSLPDLHPVELIVTTEVVGTRRSWEQKFRFDPGVGSRIPWYFSDFAWNLGEDDPDATELGEDLDRIEITTTLVAHRTGRAGDSGGIELVYTVEDDEGRRRDLLRQPVGGRADADSLVMQVTIPAADLPFGYMTLFLQLVEAGRDSVALSPPRHLFSYNIDFADDKVWERHVSWLEGVVKGDAYKDLKRIPRDRRPAAWRDFWSGSGGDPARRRHLHRILEADRRFGDFGRGSLSDQGRIFIKFGPPDRIEERDVDMSSPGSWKIWYYYDLGFSFVFYDAYGVGDYRLYSTSVL